MDDNAKRLMEAIWPPSSRKPLLINRDKTRTLTCEAYYEYYKWQFICMAPRAGTQSFAAYSQTNITNLVQLLQSDPDHEAAIAFLKSQESAPSHDDCDMLVNLAARLLLMLRFGMTRQQAALQQAALQQAALQQAASPSDLDWKSGTLSGFLEAYFASRSKLIHESIRLPKLLNAWSVAEVAGIAIDFTDNLADHLRLVEDDSKVLIFHHASFLELQQNSIFPLGFVDETIRTLALLFPQDKFSPTRRLAITGGSKRKWFQALRQKHKGLVIDPRLVLCGNLNAENRQIDCFHFWRDRLVILKQAYDEATPRTFSQWWHDGRDGVRWSTFWVAILVLIITTFLGIVQCVEGALQVYKAFN